MTRQWRHLAWLWLASIACMLPRFGRADTVLGVGFQSLTSTTLGDAEFYARDVLYYRGLGPPGEAPFALRPMSSWLASFLPLEPFAALAMVGMAGVLIGVTAMYLLSRRVSGDEGAAFLATLTFGCSFPVFYYATVATVDPLTVGLATASVALLVHDRFWLAALAGMLAVGNKEVGILVVGFAVPFLLLDARKALGSRLLHAAVLTAAALLGWYLSRKLAPPGITAYSWPMDFQHGINNFLRVKTTGAIVLSLGIQSAVVLFVWLRELRLDWDYLADPYKWGFATCLALVGYGYLVGQTDGRFIWYGQIFTTVVLAGLISRHLARMPLLARIARTA